VSMTSKRPLACAAGDQKMFAAARAAALTQHGQRMTQLKRASVGQTLHMPGQLVKTIKP